MDKQETGAIPKKWNLKTNDLPNGIIRIRKQPDKIINVDEELFFRKATDDLLNIILESVKPDLLKIKAWITRTGRIPDGVEVTRGEEKFSYTVKSRIVKMEIIKKSREKMFKK